MLRMPRDHPVVPLLAGQDEGRAPLVSPRKTEGEGRPRRGGGQGAVALLAEVARPRPVADADRAHEAGAGGQRQEAVAKADESARRDGVLEADAPLADLDDFDHFAGPPGPGAGDRRPALLPARHTQP